MTDVPRSIARPSAFVPFDKLRSVRIYQRNLPHWRQDGCTYFVTMRLGDSIPEGVQREWDHARRQWLGSRGGSVDGDDWRRAVQRLSPAEQTRFEKHFNRQVQACLDRGGGKCWLRNSACISIVRDRLLAQDGDGYHLGDFVIMPNHVHLLITPAAELGAERYHELEKLPEGNQGKHVACNRSVGRSGSFWQADSYDHIVRTLEQLHLYREYIATNPEQAGISVPPLALYRAPWADAWLRT